MDIKLNYDDVLEKRDIVRDYSSTAYWWKRGAILVKLHREEDIDYVFSLIKKAYEIEKSAHLDLIEGI